MINYGKILLQQPRIIQAELQRMLNLKIEQQEIQLDQNYSYDKSINIVNTYDLEQSTIMIEQKKRVMHSLAHIEYNALKSYIDTIIRFIHQVPQNYQAQFKEDLGDIAKDELKHFQLADKLCNYGSQPVHKNLQDRVTQTNDSILGRLAVISIVNEGRGLDTGSNLLQKMDGDEEYENVLKIILKDEVNHVRVGLKWFNFLCQDKNPQEEFLRLMKQYQIKKTWKINIQKRKQVGYNDEWIECLKEWV